MNWLRLKNLLVFSLLIACSQNFAVADIKSEADVQSVAKEHFSKLKNYSSGDLITTDDVKQLLKRLSKKGWDVPKSDELLARLIPSGSYLDQTFSTKKGMKFFREVSKVPGGVERVERMSQLRNGKGSINQLVSFPNGSDLIKELSTTQAGRNLGNRGSRNSGGVNLNKPTGKIYVEKELIEELAKIYKQDKRKRKKKKKR